MNPSPEHGVEYLRNGPLGTDAQTIVRTIIAVLRSGDAD